MTIAARKTLAPRPRSNPRGRRVRIERRGRLLVAVAPAGTVATAEMFTDTLRRIRGERD